jgi:hypothetical protein
LLDALGMPVGGGAGEGRYVIDGAGAHPRPASAAPGAAAVPVTVRSRA